MNKFKIRIKNYADKPSGFWLDSIEDGKCIITDNEEKATLFVDDTLDDLSVYDHLRLLETKHGYIGEAVLYIDEVEQTSFLELITRIRNHVESMDEFYTSPRIKFDELDKEGFQIMGDNGKGGTKILYRLVIEKL